ncbi:MAG: hypothetical protein V4474_03535 [Patescibacteria group bacterium]
MENTGEKMTKVQYFRAVASATLVDDCLGILIATGAIHVDKAGWTFWWLVLGGLWGVFWALSPDMDLVPQVLVRIFPPLRHVIPAAWILPDGYNHRRTPFHQPWLTLPTLVIVGWATDWGPFALIAFLGALCHYIHDTPTGIAWLPWQRKHLATGNFEGDTWLWQWLRPSRLRTREFTLALWALIIAAVVAIV